MSGLGLMVEQIQQYNHDALGADGWEVSAHSNSAPDHEPVQGRQLTDADFALMQSAQAFNDTRGRFYAEFQRRIGTLNCGHIAFPIILGVNSPQWTDEQLARLKADNAEGVTINGKHYTGYEATQKQRQYEQQIRELQRKIITAQESGDDKRHQELAARRVNALQQYSAFGKEAGLRTKEARLHTVGWGRSQASKARWATKRAEATDGDKTLLQSQGTRGIMVVGRTTQTAAPNAITQTTTKRGGVSRNYYDNDGQWVRQITNHNHGNAKEHPYGTKGEHAHDIVWKDGEIFDRTTRDLTGREREEDADIL